MVNTEQFEQLPNNYLYWNETLREDTYTKKLDF